MATLLRTANPRPQQWQFGFRVTISYFMFDRYFWHLTCIKVIWDRWVHLFQNWTLTPKPLIRERLGFDRQMQLECNYRCNQILRLPVGCNRLWLRLQLPRPKYRVKITITITITWKRIIDYIPVRMRLRLPQPCSLLTEIMLSNQHTGRRGTSVPVIFMISVIVCYNKEIVVRLCEKIVDVDGYSLPTASGITCDIERVG